MPRIRELILPADEGTVFDPTTGSLFFVGNATVLLRYAGFTILTDPNFVHAGDHVHLGYGLSAKRLTNPAIEIEELPHVDVCVLSHHHGDHFDPIAEERLRKDLPIVTTHHAARKLQKRGFTDTVALDTWECASIGKGPARLRITATPGRHGGPIVHHLLPPVMGSLLELSPAGDRPAIRIYITGDTLMFDDLREIPRRFPDIDLALFHLGGTRVLGLLLTMDAAQGVEAIRLVDPTEVVPIHFDDYDVFRSPLSDFLQAAEAAGLRSKVRCLGRGDTYRFEIPPARL